MEWYVPLLIVLARCCDVPLGTIRMIFVISGQKWTSVILGFFEVIIWALAVGGVITNLHEPIAIIAYGLGFAGGTWIGMTVEQRIAVGLRIVEVINPDPDVNVTERLRASGHRVTRVEGSGMRGPVEIAKTVLKRRDLPAVLEQVRTIAPEAFVSVERADRAQGAPGPAAPRAGRGVFGRLGGLRK
jgi:uncharacterized protein YebE (UPF0316 family)